MQAIQKLRRSPFPPGAPCPRSRKGWFLDLAGSVFWLIGEWSL